MEQVRSNRKGAKLRISEIYSSLQGEGLLTGTPSVFVRASGCNLRCWFCDTPFASWHPEGTYYSVDEILTQVAERHTGHVVLTGGEPFIFANLHELCHGLRSAGEHLTIETAATIYQRLECDLISISPKLSGSAPDASHGSWQRTHNQRRQRLDIVRKLMSEHPYQLKFVVDNLGDAREMLDYLQELGPYDGQRVLVMPQGTQQAELERQADWLVPWCEHYGLQFCPRAHIAWYGNLRGT
jgi:7-carboxy-7-deazaguanine synthase